MWGQILFFLFLTVLFCVCPKAETETRTWTPVICLGGDPEKQEKPRSGRALGSLLQGGVPPGSQRRGQVPLRTARLKEEKSGHLPLASAPLLEGSPQGADSLQERKLVVGGCQLRCVFPEAEIEVGKGM